MPTLHLCVIPLIWLCAVQRVRGLLAGLWHDFPAPIGLEAGGTISVLWFAVDDDFTLEFPTILLLLALPWYFTALWLYEFYRRSPDAIFATRRRRRWPPSWISPQVKPQLNAMSMVIGVAVIVTAIMAVAMAMITVSIRHGWQQAERKCNSN
jgi:hypothetical protein